MVMRIFDTIVIFLIFSVPLYAHLGWYPDLDELAKECDVIVIAEDITVNDVDESFILPNIRPEIKVIGELLCLLQTRNVG